MKTVMKSFVGIGCVLLIAELALRILAKTSPNIRFFTTNPYQQTYFAEDTGWKGITAVACPKFAQYPGAELNGFILNSHGFLSPEYPYKKPDNTKRIVFLGDSQTLGEVPYKQSFVRLIESRFQSEQKNVQTINLGVLCIGPAMEKQVLLHEGLQYQPDVVVLDFFIGNDFEDDKDVLNTYRINKVKTHLLPFWVYQSRLYSLVRNMRLYLVYGRKSPLLARVNPSEVGVSAKQFMFDTTQPTFTQEEYVTLETKKTLLFSRTSYAYFTLDDVLKNLLEIKQISEQAHAKFIVLIIPDELQINKALQNEIQQKTPIDKQSITLPQTILKTFFDKEGISYIDLYDRWESSLSAQTYYLPRDSHLNEEGNRAVTNILYPELQKLLQ